MEHVRVLGTAEPFWKNKIFHIWDWLDLPTYKDRIEVSAITNGSLMNKERRARFLQFSRAILGWSIDAASPEVYLTIRRHDLYDVVVKNLTAFCREKKLGQVCKIHNNINLINIGEVEDMVKMAADIGVDEINFCPTCSLGEYSVNRNNVALFRAQDKIFNMAEKLGYMRPFFGNWT